MWAAGVGARVAGGAAAPGATAPRRSLHIRAGEGGWRRAADLRAPAPVATP